MSKMSGCGWRQLFLPVATHRRLRAGAAAVGGTLDKYVLQIVMYCGWIELDAKLFAIQEGCGPIGRIRR
jgi:hypothetical protein